MKTLKTLFYIAAALLCCGCMPNTQLEERAIVQAAAVDFADGEYRLTMQVFDPGSSVENAGGSDAYLLLKGSGTSLTQAAQQAAEKGKEIYLGSCQVLLIGKDAQEELVNILDYFNSRPQTRATMMVAFAQRAAADILSIGDGKAKPSPAVVCEQELRLAEEEKRLPPCRLADILAALETTGRDGVLPLFGLETDNGNTKPVLQGAVILQKDTPTLVLEPEEAEVLGWFKPGRGNSLLELGPRGQNVSVLLEDFDCRLTAELKNDRPHFALTLDVKGRVSQWQNATANKTEPQQLEAARQEAAQQMGAQTNQLLQKLCAAGCDPLRFGERLQRRHPKEWNSIDLNSWPTLLQNATWDITVNCSLTSFSGQ